MPMVTNASLPLVIAVLGALIPMLNLYRLRLDREAAESSTGADSFADTIPRYLVERGSTSRSKASSRAVARITSATTVAVVLLGYAVGTRSGFVSIPGAVAVLSLVGAAVYAVSHVVWLWLDRRGDAFDMAYRLRPMVPRLYPNEPAVRRLFFSMNPMPVWSVFDRDWYRSLELPNGTQMVVTKPAADSEATPQISAS